MLADGIPHAERRIIPGAGHTLMWTHPEAVVRLVNAWLSGESPST